MKNKAIELRTNGKSIREISNLLGVSKSSVSIWCKNIELTDFQKKELDKRNPTSKNYVGEKSSNLISEKAKSKRIEYQKNGSKLAVGFNLFLAGCMLYWGEGSKNKNCVKITNYDPEMLKFFCQIFERMF